jgi:hypothetical protein
MAAQSFGRNWPDHVELPGLDPNARPVAQAQVSYYERLPLVLFGGSVTREKLSDRDWYG